MTLIGFDTSLAVTSAAVVRADGAAFCTDPPAPERLLGPAAHSQELLPELERLLAEAGSGWDDIDSIAVGVGPGTFTGLRIGVATARALAQALDASLRPVSSLEALAAGIAAGSGATHGQALLPLIDAKRRQVFAALYRAPAPGTGERPLRIWGPEALDPAELHLRIRSLDAPVCAGDWALKSRDELVGAGAEVARPDSRIHAVSALQVCALGASIEPVAPGSVHPDYVRLPDAELKAGEPKPR